MLLMSISPFNARPASPEGERRRARVVLLVAALGITATLLAYAISPGVRHAVSHAAHSVKHAVSHVFDPDSAAHRHKPPALHGPRKPSTRASRTGPTPAPATTSTAPHSK